jgi:STE24 endopeptidase
MAVFGGIYYLLGLPLSFYEGYVLPHRYQLSNQTLRGWIDDQVKGLLLGGVLGGIVLEVIYAILRGYPESWWLWVAGFMLLFNLLIEALAPVVLFPIFYKFTPLGEEHADLVERLLRLAERARTHVKGVYQFDMSRRTKAANAALTGIGKTRRIILGDTLLHEFTADEVETVLAHELAHHVHRDITWMITFQTIVILGGMYLAQLGLNWGVDYFGFSAPGDVSAFPLLLLVFGGYGLFTMPLLNAFSRWRERLADRYAVQATGNGEAFASALTRLANQNLAYADPEPWVEFLLYSHPALGKRISAARGG